MISKFGSNSSKPSMVLLENTQIDWTKALENQCVPVSQHDSLQSLLMYKTSPYIISIITFTNTLVCIVLSRNSMINPTNIILLAIAISDMLTGLFPFPIYVMHNILTNSLLFTENTQFAQLNHYLTTILPTTFHTTSVWLTIVLAFQRVIYVKFTTFVSILCTNKISVIASTLIFFLAFVMHSVNFSYYFEMFTLVSHNGTNVLVSSRTVLLYSKRKNHSVTNQMMKCSPLNDSVYLWYNSLRIIFLHVVPCILLTILTTLILIVLKRKLTLSKRLLATKKNRKFSTQEKQTELSFHRKNQTPADHVPVRVRCSKDSSSSTSKMLVVVLLIFLSVEIPMGSVITLYTVGRIFGFIRNATYWTMMVTICNFIILISYPFNFVIYCIMSKKFRDTFMETFCPNRM